MTDDDPTWMDHAACANLAAEIGGESRDRIFFPERGESVRRGKAICAQCPVRVPCLDYALDHSIRHGIWGGKSAKERSQIRRRRIGLRSA